ncbi:fumarate hydratase [Desulfofarcimen intricatum]|uniref:fumarate hydratase n=1 Tax=Desulfolucanica intricata TaxID=1285191 RepID=UPI0014724B53
MREIPVQKITKVVSRLCMDANYKLGEDVSLSIKNALKTESSSIGRDILQQIITNAEIAEAEEVPICQDTGFAVVFVELGQDVHLSGGDLYNAVNQGIRQGYAEGYLRKSIVGHPLERKNTGDNAPGIIHTKIVPGNMVKITVAPKGGGSENMSAIKMLKPADGINGVKEFVLQQVAAAGPNPCPPIIVGVGIGGTFEKAALLSKEALLRPVGKRNELPDIAELEDELLLEINKLGIGPQGLGGKTTALAVHIEVFPTHIASLPVAVNINCHASRHKTAVI